MGGKKKEALSQFNRSNIIDTAKKLFAEKGIVQTTMDDIAKEADYSKSTLYVYFKSKDEIYNYIVYESMVLLKETLEKNTDMSKSNFETCFYGICNGIATYKEEYPLYYDAMLGEISVEPADFEKYPILRDIYQVGEEINQIIFAFLEKGRERQEIRTDLNTITTSFTIWASICGIVSLAGNKMKYMEKDLNINKQQFLQDSFSLLLHSVRP